METWDKERYEQFYRDYPLEVDGIEDISFADLERLYEHRLREYHYWRKTEFKPWGIIEEQKAYIRLYKIEIKRRLKLQS